MLNTTASDENNADDRIGETHNNETAEPCDMSDHVSDGYILGITFAVSGLLLVIVYINFRIIRRAKRKRLIW